MTTVATSKTLVRFGESSAAMLSTSAMILRRVHCCHVAIVGGIAIVAIVGAKHLPTSIRAARSLDVAFYIAPTPIDGCKCFAHSTLGVGIGVDVGGDSINDNVALIGANAASGGIVGIVALIGAKHLPASIWPGAIHGRDCDDDSRRDQKGKCFAPTIFVIAIVIVVAIVVGVIVLDGSQL
ncbi:MAG: hypothetical protein ACJ8CR_23750 [Roseiflexaceae bacterium]